MTTSIVRFFSFSALAFSPFHFLLAQEQLPADLSKTLAAVSSWEIPDRNLVLASIGESTSVSQGMWVPSENATFASELIAFNAISLPEGIELTWVTAQELGTDHFAVERLLPDGRFATITMIPAAGNKQGVQMYRYLDARKESSPQTYRLRQKSENTQCHLSHPIQVIPQQDQLAILRPNLVEGNIVMPSLGTISRVHVWNRQGELVLTLVSEEESILRIPVNHLPTGEYALQLDTDSGTRSALVNLP